MGHIAGDRRSPGAGLGQSLGDRAGGEVSAQIAVEILVELVQTAVEQPPVDEPSADRRDDGVDGLGIDGGSVVAGERREHVVRIVHPVGDHQRCERSR
jgi:hypothetical protein